MFVLISSVTYDLMKGVTESLADRISVLIMFPLSLREINNVNDGPFSFDTLNLVKRSEEINLDSEILFSYIVKGMYQELYLNKNLSLDKFYSEYVATYIERDVSQLINLKDKLKFQKLHGSFSFSNW